LREGVAEPDQGRWGIAMKNARLLWGASIALSLLLVSCSTVFQGTTQSISVISNPPDARCVFEREGQVIGAIERTPGALMVRRLKEDIYIKCNKEGYQEAIYFNNSGLAGGAVAGNVAADLILTAGLSSIVDSASGADNEYEENINITLVPILPVQTPSSPVTSQIPNVSQPVSLGTETRQPEVTGVIAQCLAEGNEVIRVVTSTCNSGLACNDTSVHAVGVTTCIN
jgi:hypothetical protein